MDAWLGNPELRADVTSAAPAARTACRCRRTYSARCSPSQSPIWQSRLTSAKAAGPSAMSVPLAGKTLGILGLGAIGQELARKVSRAGNARHRHEALARSRSQTSRRSIRRRRPTKCSAASDFVLLLLPRRAETENFINADRLRAMKPTRLAAQFRARRVDRGCGPDRGGEVEKDRRCRARRISRGAAARRRTRSGRPKASRAAAHRRRASGAQCGGRRNLRRECAAFSRRESLLTAVDRARGY